MRPAPFEYHRAENLEHALGLLGEHGYDAVPLAGGQSLVPMMNLRLARPAILVDINGLDCAEIAVSAERITIGALARHRTVLEHAGIAAGAPVIREAYRFLAHPVIRNRGSTGGSVAYADPTAEIPTLLMLLDGTVKLSSRDGSRSVAAADFFQGAFTTALEPGELVTGIEYPLPRRPWSGAFREISLRHGDYAVAGAGATMTIEGGRISQARIAVSGAGSVPCRVREVEALVEGSAAGAALFDEAGRLASRILEGYDDVRASAQYRKVALGQLVRKVLTRAAERAGCEVR